VAKAYATGLRNRLTQQAYATGLRNRLTQQAYEACDSLGGKFATLIVSTSYNY